MDNAVASVIKVYAVINGFAAFILAGIISSSEAVTYYGVSAILFLLIAGTGVIASFGIYAVGEIIELLQGIKNNSVCSNSKTDNCNSNSELPPL